jgi:hypothetical protein
LAAGYAVLEAVVCNAAVEMSAVVGAHVVLVRVELGVGGVEGDGAAVRGSSKLTLWELGSVEWNVVGLVRRMSH